MIFKDRSMSKYIFRNIEEPKDIDRELVARNLVRNLEKLGKFQIEQLSGESWTHLKIHAPDNLITMFKYIKTKKYKPIIKGKYVYIYIDSNVTLLDVRMFIGELISFINTKNNKLSHRIRRKIGIFLFKLARIVYKPAK